MLPGSSTPAFSWRSASCAFLEERNSSCQKAEMTFETLLRACNTEAQLVVVSMKYEHDTDIQRDYFIVG